MGTGNRVEMMIAVCALVSSMMAVYIAWDQGRVMRAQQHGEAFPILQIDGYFSNSDKYSQLGIRVSNNGVGPALIESVALEIDGEPVDHLDEHLDAIPGNYDLSWENLIGRAIAPGQRAVPIDMSWLRDSVSFEDLAVVAASSEDWALKICYCSVFDRCWQTERLGTARAKRVAKCDRGETDIFTQLGTRPTRNMLTHQTPIDPPSPDGAPS